MLTKALLSAAFLASLSAAQPPPTNARVEGRVVNLASEAVRKAIVRISDGTIATTTDDDGRFLFDVPPGRYTLTVERVGYLSRRSPLTIQPGGAIKDLLLIMTPQAVITGRVTDQDGEPVVGRNIAAWKYPYRGGGSSLGVGGSGDTDDYGNYRIASLAPGRYYIGFGPSENHRAVLAGIVATVHPVRSKAPSEADFPTFYPNSPDIAHAEPVDVVAGGELRRIDIRLRRSHVYTIRGKVTSANETRLNDQMLTIPASDPTGMDSFAAVDANGEFEFHNILPGLHTITSRGVRNSSRGAAPTMFGSTTVNVGASDVEGVSLTLTPGLNLTGTLKVEGVSLRPQIVFLLASVEGSGQAAAVSQPDGSLAISPMPPGTYTFGIDAGQVPKGMYLKSISFGEQDAIQTPLNLGVDAGGRIDIVYSDNAAELTGVLKNADGEPAAGVTVAVWPKTPKLGLSGGGIHSVITDQDGGFLIVDLGPGDYYIAGFEEIEAGLVQNVEFPTRLNVEASEIRIEEGAKTTIEPKPISRERVAAEIAKLP